MTTIEQQILDTWFINHRTNLLIMDSITEDALMLTTSKRGGGTVGHQLAHICNVRFWKLEKLNKELVKDMTSIKADDVKTIELLKDFHIKSSNLVADVLQKGIENGGDIKGNKRGLIPLLGYFIHHDAHHRGNILLTLKLCGFKLTEELIFGIWEWNKL